MLQSSNKRSLQKFSWFFFLMCHFSHFSVNIMPPAGLCRNKESPNRPHLGGVVTPPTTTTNNNNYCLSVSSLSCHCNINIITLTDCSLIPIILSLALAAAICHHHLIRQHLSSKVNHHSIRQQQIFLFLTSQEGILKSLAIVSALCCIDWYSKLSSYSCISCVTTLCFALYSCLSTLQHSLRSHLSPLSNHLKEILQLNGFLLWSLLGTRESERDIKVDSLQLMDDSVPSCYFLFYVLHHVRWG